jgi:alkylated DNA repair dioxygenase AlkB
LETKMDALFDTPDGWETVPAPDADLRVLPPFYRKPDTDAFMQRLLDETPWQQETITLWGKQHLQPRLSAWYGDPGSGYSYSGVILAPHPWTATLLRIKADVEAATDSRFNSVLLNLYRDENDSVWDGIAMPSRNWEAVQSSRRSRLESGGHFASGTGRART